MRQSNLFKYIRRMPKTVKGKPNRDRTKAFRALNAIFEFREYDLHSFATKIQQSWTGDFLDANTAQKMATRAFKAVQRKAFGKAKRVRFKGKNQIKSLDGKTNKSGIRYNEKTAHVEWSGLKLKCLVDTKDKVVAHGLSHRVKFCRIIRRIFNATPSFFVQLILDGKPFIKKKNKAGDSIVGLDIGPSTIAVVTDEYASLERFCDELKDKQKEIRRLQRKNDRQRRANNPQNYNPDGTIKPGKKTWNDSKRYSKTQTKLAEFQRKLAAYRESLHGNLANRILRLGKYIKTEKLSYSSFQKNYGRSVRDRAPGKFMEILRRKAENAGGTVNEFPTKDTKLSQYCHACGKYTKKDLSQRVHTCCNLNIQRDIYSAFLAGSVVENSLDTADVQQRWRSMEAILQRAVSEQSKSRTLATPQVASGRQLPSSFGLRVRDRVTRLRSSDVQHLSCDGIPDAKPFDVVPACNTGERATATMHT